MKIEVIGVERKNGTFKNPETGVEYPYDNLMLHGIQKRFSGEGQGVQVVKVACDGVGAELIAECGGNINGIIGHTISFDTSRFGKVTDFDIINYWAPSMKTGPSSPPYSVRSPPFC